LNRECKKRKIIFIKFLCGALHSGLVHLFWEQKVVRSNRTAPTKKKVLLFRDKYNEVIQLVRMMES
jgi:hypothetical protein